MKAGLVLKDEFDKPVWATPGRCIARNMLLAFIEEAGNENAESHDRGVMPKGKSKHSSGCGHHPDTFKSNRA